MIKILAKMTGVPAMAILFLALAASPGQVQAGGGYELVWGSFGGAHGTASGGGYQLQGQKS